MEPQINLLSICRTCESTKNLVEIDAITGLQLLLESLLYLKVIPKRRQICSQCVETIQQFEALRLTSQEVEARLFAIYEVESQLKLEVYVADIASTNDFSAVDEDPEPPTEIKLEVEKKVEEDKEPRKRKKRKPKMSQRTGVMCDECGKPFSIVSNMMKHKKNVHSVKHERCPYCEKSFLKKTHLNDHVNKHTQQEIYICNYCRKGYYEKRILVKHLREQ